MTNAVGGFEWPGSSMNELKLIYIPSLEDTFIYNRRQHALVEYSFIMKGELQC